MKISKLETLRIEEFPTCMVIRRRRPKDLGSVPISIGLWVGGGVTRNRHDGATPSP